MSNAEINDLLRSARADMARIAGPAAMANHTTDAVLARVEAFRASAEENAAAAKSPLDLIAQ